MAYTLSSEFPEDRWPTKAPIQARTRPTDRRIEESSLDKRASRGFVRFLMIFSIGVAATLAWQSYGEAAREMVAKSSPQLRWLAPQSQTAPDMVAATARATPSPDVEQLKAMSLGLAVVRQSVDQLAAAQQQMTDEIAKLQATEQEILDKVSAPPRPTAAPAPTPARKSAPPALPPSSQGPPAR